MSSLTSKARRSVGSLLDASPQRWRDRAFRALAPRVSDEALLSCHVIDQNAVLRHLAKVGFTPDAIIDVGAYVGEWSASATEIFPGLPTLMIDGNPSRRDDLAARARTLGPLATSEIALLGAAGGTTVPFFEIGTGSSAYRELTNLDKQVHELPLHRLDDVTQAFFAHVGARPSNALLKIDVQGYELEVLAGATELLANVGALVIELSLIQYNEGAPLAHEVINRLLEAGLVMFDVCDLHRRETDSSLFQIDLVFIPASSPLRGGSFWLAEGTDSTAPV